MSASDVTERFGGEYVHHAEGIHGRVYSPPVVVRNGVLDVYLFERGETVHLIPGSRYRSSVRRAWAGERGGDTVEPRCGNSGSVPLGERSNRSLTHYLEHLHRDGFEPEDALADIRERELPSLRNIPATPKSEVDGLCGNCKKGWAVRTSVAEVEEELANLVDVIRGDVPTFLA